MKINMPIRQFAVLTLFSFLALLSYSQDIGIGTTVPKSKISISGNLTVGASYAGVKAAPANGAIIQGQVGIGNNSPNASAILDLSNSSGLGFLVPSMNTAAMNSISAPALGLTIFNSDINCLEVNLSAGTKNWAPACE